MAIYGPTGADVFLENVKAIQATGRQIQDLGGQFAAQGAAAQRSAEENKKNLAEKWKMINDLVNSDNYKGDWALFAKENEGLSKDFLRNLYGGKLDEESLRNMSLLDRLSIKKRAELYNKRIDERYQAIVAGQSPDQRIMADLRDAAKEVQNASVPNYQMTMGDALAEDPRITALKASARHTNAGGPTMADPGPSTERRGPAQAMQLGFNASFDSTNQGGSTSVAPTGPRQVGPSTTFGQAAPVNPNLTTDELTVGTRMPVQGTPNRKFYDATNPQGTVLSDTMYKARSLWQETKAKAEKMTSEQRGGLSPENYAKMVATEQALGVSTADELAYMNAVNTGKSEAELADTKFAKRAAELGVTPTQLRQMRGPDFQGQLTGELTAPVKPVERYLTAYNQGAPSYEKGDMGTPDNPPPNQAVPEAVPPVQAVPSGVIPGQPLSSSSNDTTALSQAGLVREAANQKLTDLKTMYERMSSSTVGGEGEKPKDPAAKEEFTATVLNTVAANTPNPARTVQTMKNAFGKYGVSEELGTMATAVFNGLINEEDLSPKDKRAFESTTAKLVNVGPRVAQTVARTPEWKEAVKAAQAKSVEMLTNSESIFGNKLSPEEKTEYGQGVLRSELAKRPLVGATAATSGGLNTVISSMAPQSVKDQAKFEQDKKVQDVTLQQNAERLFLDGITVKQAALRIEQEEKRIAQAERGADQTDAQIRLAEQKLKLDAAISYMNLSVEQQKAFDQARYNDARIAIEEALVGIQQTNAEKGSAPELKDVDYTMWKEAVNASETTLSGTAKALGELTGNKLKNAIISLGKNEQFINAVAIQKSVMSGNAQFESTEGIKKLLATIKASPSITGQDALNMLRSYVLLNFKVNAAGKETDLIAGFNANYATLYGAPTVGAEQGSNSGNAPVSTTKAGDAVAEKYPE